jgi:hypothetical protein
MELNVYACILAPFKEWEVLTMIRNILAKRNREDKTNLAKINPQNIRGKLHGSIASRQPLKKKRYACLPNGSHQKAGI